MDDPILISGMYNYCHRRCERCPFTERCLTFRHLREDDVRRPGRDALERVGDNFARTFDLLRAWCERESIDFDKLREDANSEEARAEVQEVDDAVDRDPPGALAQTYTFAAMHLASALERLAPFHEWSPVFREALDTIGWYAGTIPAKVHRALYGLADRDRFSDEDPVQNDGNGSAKIARLAIDESQRAWDTPLLVGKAPPDAPLRKTRELLDRIDCGLADRFRDAMDFVRPGFDEPEVAAGALTALACFEPRRRHTRATGLRGWLEPLAALWRRIAPRLGPNGGGTR